MRTLLLLSLSLLGCYSPAIPSGAFACGVDGRCPDGQSCVDGLCVTGGEARDLRGAPAPDLAQPGPGGEADLSSGQADPCSAGWTEISAGSIYACRRTFAVTAGAFDGLCRGGYHVCNAGDDLSAVSASSGTRCSGAGGFYMTQIDIALRNIDSGDRTADGTCSPQSGDTARALLGCGSESGLYRLGSSGCNQLKTALRCSSAPSGWSCTSVRDAAHSSAPGGVLCCVDR